MYEKKMYYVELWFYWYNFEPVVLDTAKTVSGGGAVTYPEMQRCRL